MDASSGVKVNAAMVVTPDIEADNGVIYVVDTVLLPPQG
ncbi:fasciclin domain-containing protein [Trichocoleus sp. FACHB-69]|nr:fasciclin domain-containing protein [Trichocoleus sp. FACHB-69]MBD1930807.1 fasciclin domain-containing protein [Trichocoleus sp. FACHB-69]